MNIRKSLEQSVIEKLLTQVKKPARYIGGEWNQVKKDPDQVKVKIALAFPDVYEIGMFYLGFQILYELINQKDDYCAERCYTPWTDMEALLRQNNLPLFTLESGLPLNSVDVVGITLQHEMAYTNILNLLDLGQLPVERADRQDSHPLVIGGGPCVVNPEPIEQAFDLFVLGDGETVIFEILDFLKKNPTLSRVEKIKQLANISGIYAPGLYIPRYDSNHRLTIITTDEPIPLPITRRVEPTAALPKKPLVPFLAPIHDRVTTQLFRGCTRGCRFCQAGMINRPIREQNPETVINHLKEALESSGYEEASLTSLSSGDYSQILPIVRQMMAYCLENDVALSFPSLRLDSFRTELAETIHQVRKTGLTFAPEAGSGRLRHVINKGLNEEDFTKSLGKIFYEGWDLVKLYFMIGLPTETEEDIHAIIHMVNNILKAGRRAKQGQKKKRPPRVNLGVNLFIPKPHTPFQWEPQLDRETAKKRLTFLAQALPKAAGFGLGKRTDEELNRSYLEAVLARGDRRLWPVLKTAWKNGAKFDSWGDLFAFDKWINAFEVNGINPDDYALRKRAPNELLPWDHLDFGVKKSFLLRELEKSEKAVLTPDCCRENRCQGCGAADPKNCPLPAVKELTEQNPPKLSRVRPERPVVRIRLSYEKKDAIRFVGHLDMVNAWRRAGRRARLPIHYSQGFHPQPTIGFGPPLPLGYIGLEEWMDIGFEFAVNPDEVLNKLNNSLPLGLKALTAYELPITAPSLNEVINGGRYHIYIEAKAGLKEELKQRIQKFWQTEEVPVEQWSKKGTVTINCRTGVWQLMVEENQDEITIPIVLFHQSGQPKTAKIPTIISWLSRDLIQPWEITVIRTHAGQIQNNEIIQPV